MLLSLACGAVLAAISCASPPSEDWTLVDARSVGLAAVDRQSVESRGDVRVFRMVYVYRRAEPGGGDYAVLDVAMNCRERASGNLSITAYSLDGVRVAMGEPDASPEPITPNSVGDSAYRAVCENQWIAGLPSFGSVSEFAHAGRITLLESFSD